MTYIIIKALSPIFIIMLLGFWAGKRKMVDNQNVSLLNVFVMDFALPATLFTATVQTPWQGILQQWYLVIIIVLAMWITFFVFYFITTKYFKKTASDAAVLTLTVALPNYAALGLPILNSIVGETSATSLSVAICIACGSVFLTPLCLLILEREKALADGSSHHSTLTMLPSLIWRSMTKPIVLCPLLGVICSAFNLIMPEIVIMAIKPLGLASTAAALFLTGLILSARKLKINMVVIVSCSIKLLVQPFIAWGLVLLFGVEGSLAITAILVIAFAAGFFGVVFGNRFGVESPDAEATLLLTSLLNIITLPLFITLTVGL